MMVTKVLGTEASLPTTTGTATSFSEARRVRLCNISGANREITIVATQSGTVIGKFTLPPTNDSLYLLTSLARVSTGYILPFLFLMLPCKNTPSI